MEQFNDRLPVDDTQPELPTDEEQQRLDALVDSMIKEYAEGLGVTEEQAAKIIRQQYQREKFIIDYAAAMGLTREQASAQVDYMISKQQTAQVNAQRMKQIEEYITKDPKGRTLTRAQRRDLTRRNLKK